MNDALDPGVVAATRWVWGGGWVLGFVFGFVAARSNFCTMGALSDWVNMGHTARLRMWLLAIAVAVAGTTALTLGGWVDIGKAVAQRPVLPWLSLLFGGLLFGVGMTLAGGCANKNLIRAGAGSVRSMVVLLVMGLFSYMTLKGVLALPRARALDPVALPLGEWGWTQQGLPTALARVTGLADATALGLTAGVVVVCLLAYVLVDRRFRQDARKLTGGVVLGLVIAAGWFVTGHLGFGEDPQTMEQVYFGTNTRTLESLSFVAPVAYSIELLTLWTDTSLKPTFGIWAVVGVLCGSAAHALGTGAFRWEGFASLQDLRNQLAGAALMGFGGVTALGCTVGQGLTGLSTLSIGAVLAVLGIAAGCVGTLKWMLWAAERAD
jgi:uncharacterized protein